MQAVCGHLADIDPERPDPVEVCPACVAIDSPWVHLRQCLACGATNCCDSSPNRHASAHFHETGHPVMRTLEPDEDWAWCFVDRLTMEPDGDGWAVVDPFFDAGLWFARQAIARGETLPFPPGTTAEDGFPLAVWETTVRGRAQAGTLDPDHAVQLDRLPGWRS